MLGIAAEFMPRILSSVGDDDDDEHVIGVVFGPSQKVSPPPTNSFSSYGAVHSSIGNATTTLPSTFPAPSMCYFDL